MCGIVGYIGAQQAQPILLDSLHRLEYRGYDSAGIAVVGDTLQVEKCAGKVSALEAKHPHFSGTWGIGHTRWATHGPPTDSNAHPFLDATGQFALIHNGIIENYQGLRQELVTAGVPLTSQTDSEVLVQLIARADKGDTLAAVRSVLNRVEGSYGIVVIHRGRQELVAARNQSPLVIGLSTGEQFVASDIPAMLRYTNEMVYLQDGQLARLTPSSVEISDLAGASVPLRSETITWNAEDAERGGYEHFMLKEIFEQPKAILETMLERVPDLDLGLETVRLPRRIRLVACGTAFHAAMLGKVLMEQIAGIPSEAILASEFTFSGAVGEPGLVIAISQSGETLDTLSAVREARRRGAQVVAVCNVMGSTLTRETEHVLMTRAGPEIGVAATKTFTSQLVALYLLAAYLGRRNRHLEAEQVSRLVAELRRLPRLVQGVLDNHQAIQMTAEWIASAKDAFFIGRQFNYPTALEGALKLKEISYIHAEGYAAGELKHGPIALFGKDTPVIAIVPKDETYAKMINAIRESGARGTPVIAIATEGDQEVAQVADIVIRIPESEPRLSPVLATVALQLLSYYVAKYRGCEIDKPRNLAKSVTVE